MRAKKQGFWSYDEVRFEKGDGMDRMKSTELTIYNLGLSIEVWMRISKNTTYTTEVF